MKQFSSRYVLEEVLCTFDVCTLYIGKDTTLQRIVLIYVVPILGEKFVEEYTRRLGKIEEATNNPLFLQIFDAEIDQQNMYLVLNYKEGHSLQQMILTNSLPFRDKLAMIVDLSQRLLDAAEEQPLHFSISADNLWVSDDQTITVINIWDNSQQIGWISKDLCCLFYQLITCSKTIPSDPQLFVDKLHHSLHDLSVDQKETVVKVIKKTWEARLPLMSFIDYLKGLQKDLNTEESIPLAKQSKLLQEKPIILPQDISHQPPTNHHGFRSNGIILTALKHLYLLLLSKKLWRGMAITLLSLVVFVIAFALLIENSGRIVSTPKIIESNEEPSLPVTKTNPIQEESQDRKSNTNDSQSSTINVPNLIGLTKNAAEQQALTAGLHYTYYLEENNQDAGIVFKQEPMPNETVVKGSHIVFWVSKGVHP